MRDDNMPFNLEFYLNEDGLNIVGNRSGLSQLAQELKDAAEAGSDYHEHLTFSFSEHIESNNFKINLQIKKDQSNTEKVTNEITIYNSEKDFDQLL